jgi:hypothetical protein
MKAMNMDGDGSSYTDLRDVQIIFMFSFVISCITWQNMSAYIITGNKAGNTGTWPLNHSFFNGPNEVGFRMSLTKKDGANCKVVPEKNNASVGYDRKKQ